MKKFFYCLIAAVAVCCMTACGSDDNGDEPGKVELTNGQTNKVDCWSNTTSGQITFSAPAGWTATVEAVSRAGADWLHLDRTSGSAGDVTLTFTLDSNNTGASRSANIIITSGNSREIIGINQSPEADPDGGDQPTHIAVASLKNVFKNGYVMMDFDSNKFSFDEKSMRVNFIQGNQGECDITYHDNLSMVTLNGSFRNEAGETLYTERCKINLGENAFAKSLTYYKNDYLEGFYTFEYDDNGRMTKCIGQYGDYKEESELIWDNGNIVKVITDSGSGNKVTTDFTYTDIANTGNLMLYDGQLWIDDEDDILEIFYFCGLLGTATKNLVKSSSTVGIDGGDAWRINYNFQYSIDGNGLPTTLISRVSGDEGQWMEEANFAWTKLF